MVKDQYVASLIRQGEAEPYDFEVLPANEWDDAENLANEWAMTAIAASGGLSEATSLHLKYGAKGKFLRNWSGF